MRRTTTNSCTNTNMAGQQDSTRAGKEGSSELETDNYDWLSYRPEVEEKEKGLQKLKTLFIKNPFVPLGVLSTTAALGAGLHALVNRNSQRQQLMMRLRVFGQGFTVVALLGGVLYHPTP